MVTRSSIVWVMTGIAAGAAGGWLWNRDRSVEFTPPPAAATRAEAVRSPFAPPGERRLADLSSRLSDRLANPPGAQRAAAESKAASSQRRALQSKVAQADREELESMIADANSLPGHERRRTLQILLLRYAEIDTDGALDYAMAADRATAKHLVQTLADVVPERAWERAVRERDPAARLAYLEAVVSSWAEQEPQRVFAAVRELPADWQRKELLQHATTAIATQDPQLAIELVEAMEPSLATPLLDTVAEVWSRNDPSAAARWIESKPLASQQGRLAYRVAEAYLAQKPAEALAWALRLSRSPQRYLWSSMLGQMAAYDPGQALQLAQSAEGPAQRTQALGNVLAAIAQRDPALAMSHLMKMPASEVRSNVLSRIAESVATRMPSAALDWLAGIDDRRMQQQAAVSLGYELARRDVEAAAQLLDRVPEFARRNWINAVAQAYVDIDVEKGRQWVRKHSKESADAAFGFTQMVAARNPELGLQMVEETANDRERERLLMAVLPMIAQHIPEAAAEWAERLADGSARTQAIDAVAGTWAHHDPEAARKWVLSLPSGQDRDQAISTFIQAQDLPLDDVLSVINRIQMPERRMHAVLTAAMRLSQSDPEGAQTLLRRYPLDPQRQRQFDEYARRRGAGQ